MPRTLALARFVCIIAVLAATACDASTPDAAPPDGAAATAKGAAEPGTGAPSQGDAAAPGAKADLSLDGALSKLGDALPRELDGKPRAFFLEALIASRCAETRASLSDDARAKAPATIADRYGWTADALKATHTQHASAVSKLGWVTRAMDDAHCAHYPLQLDASDADSAALKAPDDALAGFVRGEALLGPLDLKVTKGAVSGTLKVGERSLALKGSARGRVFTATADQDGAKLLVEGRVEEGDRARGVVKGVFQGAPVQAPFVAAR